ncbi:MFS general substrate transporter [Dichomitus squalens LYAD-421 SS1]|uniref:MFS general substrate transporter n=1 Tax=Dichomitus squalens (strain LYAD-421) TaxID=732165 RepID=R7SI35_DICSQ|nr:MFS general substrate transporter [Dichomitus squalens LYAD-421 SS1]EJF55809.1 MFS general substrate transporter [Dichomitus squalens LYAD-421 SS1]
MSLEEKKAASIDESAASVEQREAGFESKFTAEDERRLVRKLDCRIMPIACIMYLFAYLDRTNLGNARLQGLPQDVLHGDPTGVLFDWVNSAFFFSYILCQIPATIVSKLLPPRAWLGCAAVGWGICSVLMSTAFNFPGLIVARVGLGVFEAGFGPGIPLYMSFFYTKEEMGMRMAYWFGFAAVAGAFGGLIAFGIQHVHAAVANWKLLFVVEGIPTVLIGLLSILILPNRPEETSMFNEKERELALERANRGLKSDTGRVVNKSHIKAAFKDWRIYAAGVMYFGANCALASISAFLPTIIKTFGFTNALAQLLTVPPYAVAAIFLCLNSYISDRLQSRGPFVAGVSALAAIGYVILLAVPENVHARYFATFCIVSGTYTTIGVIIAWFAHNLGSETKKATGIPMYMAIGQCGSVLGSHLFPSTEGPRYIKGFAVTCALEFLAAIVAIVLTVNYRLENKRRDREHGKPILNATVDTSDLADQAPDFRYVP